MGTPATTWDAAYEATPAGSDDPRAADDRMREIKTSVRERKEREHGGAIAEATARHGVHRKGSARASYDTGDPTTAPDGTSTRALSATDDDGRIHVDATTKKIRVYDGANWQDVEGFASGVHLKKIEIGDWNIDTPTPAKLVAHGLALSKIISVSAMIRNDADTAHYQAMPMPGGTTSVTFTVLTVDATNVNLLATGTFDSADFNSTSYNRGWVLIWYTD